MKEILKSTPYNTRNAEHFQFHADENTAFIQNQAYESTNEVEEKDKVRDDLFLYIKQTIESDLNCPLSDKEATAVKLEFASFRNSPTNLQKRVSSLKQID